MTEAEKEIAAQLRDKDEMTLNALADRIARRIETDRLRGIVREMVMMFAVEQEVIRRDGLGRSLLLALRRAGLKPRMDDRTLKVGPPDKLTVDMKALIQTFRHDIIRELEKE